MQRILPPQAETDRPVPELKERVGIVEAILFVTGDAVEKRDLCRALEVTEARLVGEKAVFKGSANVEVLYTTEQGTVEQWQTSLPFSQYM